MEEKETEEERKIVTFEELSKGMTDPDKNEDEDDFSNINFEDYNQE